MKTLRACCFLFAVAAVASAVPLSAQTPEKAVLAGVQALFDGMANRDATAIKASALPGGGLLSMRDGKATQMTFDSFAERIGKPAPTKIQERIHDPKVHIDNDLAVVWAPYEFLVDDKVDHCGTDLFNMAYVDGAWKIASIAYTNTKACSR